MTLISAYNIGMSPVVIGDLLLSGPEQLEKEVEIPVIGDVRRIFPKGSGWSIVGLRQKVNLVADNCVVAWAGSMLAATIVINELRALASVTDPTFEQLAEYFNNIDPGLVQLGVSLVGWVKEENGFRRFYFDATTTNAGLFGEMSVAGSGTESFLKLIEGMPLTVPAADRKINSLEEAISVSLMSTGIMLQSEFHTKETLLNFFGGGYEIATFLKDKFSKIGDITFVCWIAEFHNDSVRLSLPVLALKQKYVGDILFIRSARFDHSKSDIDMPLVEESYNVVSPLYRVVTAGEVEHIPLPDMNSTFTCHCILVQSDGPLQVLVRIEYRSSGVPTSILFKDSKELIFSVEQKFIEGLARSVHNRYKTK